MASSSSSSGTLDPSLVIKCCLETDNFKDKKCSEVWKYFGRIFRDGVQLDNCYHCMLCFNEKKLPKK